MARVDGDAKRRTTKRVCLGVGRVLEWGVFMYGIQFMSALGLRSEGRYVVGNITLIGCYLVGNITLIGCPNFVHTKAAFNFADFSYARGRFAVFSNDDNKGKKYIKE